MALSNDQWQLIAKELSTPFGQAVLMIDGYRIALRVEPLKKLRYVIVVYVNGAWKGVWMHISKDGAGSEEGRRFYPVKQRALFSEAERRALIKTCGKRRAKEGVAFKKYSFRLPYWTSVDAMRRHFIKHNASIDFVSVGYVP